MKRWMVCTVLALLTVRLAAQQPIPTPKAADPYQPTLQRLESMTSLPLPEWRFHTDIPHPEDSSVNDSAWETIKVGDNWSTGSRVLRRWIEIPEKIDGYAVRGARAKLDLSFDFLWNNKGPVTIAVFSNGSLVSRGDDDMQQPILLTENAQPGQKFLIAVRIDAPEVETLFQHAKLSFEPAAGRPDPAMVRTEILAARPMIAAYEEGRAERQAATRRRGSSHRLFSARQRRPGRLRRLAAAGTEQTASAESMDEAVHRSRRRQLAHRHGLAVAVDGNGRSGAQYLSERSASDARISRFQVHHVVGANL